MIGNGAWVLGLSESVSRYYDGFGDVFLRDLVHGNRRVELQYHFFEEVIDGCDARSALIVGCGWGEVAHRIVKRNPAITVTAIDISGRNVRIANSLFPHQRLQFREVDIYAGISGGPWDLVLMPDVYEHIPAHRWAEVHAVLAGALSECGSIAMTYPSPEHQQHLRGRGSGLQLVDEVVMPGDILELAERVGGKPIIFKYVSAFATMDYIHVLIRKDVGYGRPVRRGGVLSELRRKAVRLWRPARLRKYRRKLRQAGVDTVSMREA